MKKTNKEMTAQVPCLKRRRMEFAFEEDVPRAALYINTSPKMIRRSIEIKLG
jgi:hypothetical protein